MIVKPIHTSLNDLTGGCSLKCANGGYCAINEETSASHNLLDGQLRQMCICPKGYTGLSCLQPIESMAKCHVHKGIHYCLNGGHCRQVFKNGGIGFLSEEVEVDESNMDEIDWRCDCVQANGASQFAGDMCRRPHTEYCDHEGKKFCTNGGSCINSIVFQAHSVQYEGSDGCVCPQEFTGPHCEYLNEQYEFYRSSIDNQNTTFGPPPPELNLIERNIDAASIILSFFVVIGVLGVAAFSWKLNRKLRRRGDGRGGHQMINDQFSNRRKGRVEFFHDDGQDVNGYEEKEYVMTEVRLT